MNIKSCIITAAALGGVATAWAANIPNATDEGALRLGPMGVGALGPSSAFGGGAALWAQYDGSWFGVDVRLGGHVLKPDAGSTTSVRWENEYRLYLLKGKFRPYLAAAIGLGYFASEYDGSIYGPFREEDFHPVVASYFGIRLNSLSSPFYITFDGGYKYVDREGCGTIRNRYYFALSKNLGFRAGLEAGFEFDDDSFGYGLIDIGPFFSF